MKDFTNFDIEDWPFRDIEEMKQDGNKAQNLKDPSTFARTHAGVIHCPLFDFKLEMTVPCFLHLLMALGRKMLKMIISEAQGRPTMEEKMEAILQGPMGIKLNPKEKTLSLKVKKSRLSRTDIINVLKHHELLVNVLAEGAISKSTQKHVARVRTNWKLMVQLLALISTSGLKISEAFWKKKALEFARAFTREYESKDVISYLHAFAYHVGYFVEKYGSLERLANYGIEGLHAKNKKVIREATNGFKLGPRLTLQELQHHFRQEYHRGKLLNAHKVEKHRSKGKGSWVEAKLDLLVEYESFLKE